MVLDIEEVKRRLRAMDRDYTDPDWTMLNEVREELSVAVGSGWNLHTIFDVVKTRGFSGSLDKFSKMLEALGIRQRRRGRRPKKWVDDTRCGTGI